MASCACFGHHDVNYEDTGQMLHVMLMILIERFDVTEFYSGGRGKFDRFFAERVGFLKKTLYPHIRNTMVYSYIPAEKEKERPVPSYYDDTVYLLEKEVPKKFAIVHTNQAIVDKVDFVVSGVFTGWGGAWRACDHARRKNKPIFNIYDYYDIWKGRLWDEISEEEALDEDPLEKRLELEFWWKMNRTIERCEKVEKERRQNKRGKKRAT